MKKTKHLKFAVINTITKEIVSRHFKLTGAFKGLADAGGFDTNELSDL